jgi:radical SAM protein with 4Fe4S-binding SPASM domain
MLILSAPVHYTLELTPHCNNHCTGCGNIPFSQQPPLLAATWQDILHKVHPHATHIRLSGGEPTLHPKFETIVNFIAELDMPFILFTNARWKNSDHLIRFLAQIPQCKGLLVSLHGHTPELHESFTRTKGSFSETVQNIQKAIDGGLTIAISTILTPSNYNHINEMIAFSKKLGAYQTTFSRYVSVKSNVPEINPDQLRESVTAIEENRKNGAKVEYSVCIPQCFTPSSSIGCLSGITYCVIDPWGNVRPCTHVPINCGNLLEKSIEEIWHGPEMQRWRDMIPGPCYDCLEISKCRGGCRAMALLNHLSHDPLMGRPITEKPEDPDEKMVLYEGMSPVGQFTIRSESFGYILISENRVVPVAFESRPILDLLDGNHTLKQIKEKYGGDAQQILDFIGHLYQEGMVEMRSPDALEEAG